MDLVVLYLVAAAGLISLILLAVKLRGHPAAAAREQQNGVPARAVAHRPVAEDRGADMPRRRRNLNSRVMAQRRAQRDASVPFLSSQEEEERRAKEEQERREEEEYQRLKESFVIEEQGVAEELTEQESHNLLQEFIQYIKDSKVVLLEDLASHFEMRTQDAISRLQDLIADGSLTGVIDDRGKFIFITPEELRAVGNFIKQRGRVSITELAQASNSLINLNPVEPSTA
ncbi:DDRGK domain-containing protein 1-like [Scleropages formosus]|uniref:DDRGK domain-containing protein 1 n=1 Tax=Scleropages formosus TaxID=113540 RepID=A0A0P7UG95_SCLFO|nr:DDRGK domain-containing protein 1-like [Scleropages formosus]